mgnify:CR=1 FL=1
MIRPEALPPTLQEDTSELSPPTPRLGSPSLNGTLISQFPTQQQPKPPAIPIAESTQKELPPTLSPLLPPPPPPPPPSQFDDVASEMLCDMRPEAVARREKLYAATLSKMFPTQTFESERQKLLLAKTLAGPTSFPHMPLTPHALSGRAADTLHAIEALQSELHDDTRRWKIISRTLTSQTLEDDLIAPPRG